MKNQIRINLHTNKVCFLSPRTITLKRPHLLYRIRSQFSGIVEPYDIIQHSLLLFSYNSLSFSLSLSAKSSGNEPDYSQHWWGLSWPLCLRSSITSNVRVVATGQSTICTECIFCLLSKMMWTLMDMEWERVSLTSKMKKYLTRIAKCFCSSSFLYMNAGMCK